MLVAEFVVGMVVNVLPARATVFGLMVLSLHELIGVGLVIAAAVLVGHTRTMRRWAVVGAVGTMLAFGFGVLTITAPWPGLWSFLMACAFMLALLAYLRLWTQARDRSRRPEVPHGHGP